MIENPTVGLIAGVLAMMMAVFAVLFIVSIGIYIYTSFAFMSIGKKTKVELPGLAWIPGIGPILIAYFSDKRNTTTPFWVLLISVITNILGSLFLGYQQLGIIMLILGGALALVSIGTGIYFVIWSYIWEYRMFEAVHRPGWWALIPVYMIIYIVFFGLVGLIFNSGFLQMLILAWGFVLVYFIVLGIAAWSKE